MADAAENHYRASFFLAVDTALTQLRTRLDKKAVGIQPYLSLEQILLSGEIPVQSDLCDTYCDILKCSSLPTQLTMFRAKYPVKSLCEAQTVFQDMVPEVRCSFNGDEHLIRLLLICSVSSCTAERSFSALRRLKNWLRSTMSQQRLNGIATCHTNKKILDE